MVRIGKPEETAERMFVGRVSELKTCNRSHVVGLYAYEEQPLTTESSIVRKRRSEALFSSRLSIEVFGLKVAMFFNKKNIIIISHPISPVLK